MRTKALAAIAVILVLLALKKAFEPFVIIPITIEGMRAAAQGSDISPYITGMLVVVLIIVLPTDLIRAMADA